MDKSYFPFFGTKFNGKIKLKSKKFEFMVKNSKLNYYLGTKIQFSMKNLVKMKDIPHNIAKM